MYKGAWHNTGHLLSLCLFVFFTGFHGINKAEGTKQLEPNGAPVKSVCKLTLSQTEREHRIPFALLNCSPDFRLNVRISDFTTEKIYLGFGDIVKYYDTLFVFTDVSYQVKDPNGIPLPDYSLRQVPLKGNTGHIGTRNQVDAGPNINNSNPAGYSPLILTPTMNGDYVIEFKIPDAPPSTSSTDEMRELKYFDVTVARGNSPVPGRLWSKAWQLSSGNVSTNVSASYTLFYIYTNDSIVTRFDSNGLAGGVWSIYSNEWGCSTTGTWSDRRQSIPGNASVKPEYKIFLNDPDPLEFPSGHIGEMISFKIQKEECDTVITFETHVNKAGNIEILLDVPPVNPGYTGPEDVQLGYSVTNGYNVLLPAWDGKNKFGVAIDNGTEIKASIRFLNGLSNIPLYDVEDNPKGFKVDIQRPLPPTGNTKLKLFWDDTKLSARYMPTSNVTDGCIYTGFDPLSGCHPWTETQGLGDTNTINTWWYLTSNHTLEVSFKLNLRPSSGNITGPVNVCDGQKVSFSTRSIPFAREYLWQLDGPGVEYNYKTSVPDTAFTYEFPVSWPQGRYLVSVYGRNPQCFDGEKVYFSSVVHNPPKADYSNTNPCQSTGITFTDQSTPADAALNKFTWTVNSSSGDKRTFSGNPAVIVFDSLAGYSVSLIATDLLGCSDSVKKIITVKPKPESNFEYSENPDMKGELRLVNQTAGASSYFWDFGNSITSALAEPDIKYTIEGDYTIMLVATTPDGCHDTATREYYYAPGLWMPDAFTPNQDGKNDIFRPVTRRIRLDPYQLLIYNRWGQLVFQTTDASQGWDGTLNGEKCPTGNYSYYIQYRDSGKETIKTLTQRGIVRLIR